MPKRKREPQPARCEVKLAQQVWNVLRDRLTPAERDAFVSRLEAVRRDPLRLSESLFDATRSPYMLRTFRFGAGEHWLAVFAFDPARQQIKVIECRLARPGHPRRNGHTRPGGPG